MSLPGAKVIWGSNWNSSPGGETLTFVEYFKPYCSSPITVQASADDSFELKINGPTILTGNSWRSMESKVIKLKQCEKYKLTIEGTNSPSGTPAGVIYQLTQDMSCTECPPGSHFNPETCQCECIQDCECKKPRSQWYGYPHCNCDCPKR